MIIKENDLTRKLKDDPAFRLLASDPNAREFLRVAQ